jgi:cytoskeletal protein CcmA (bactofilin family)
MTTANTTDSAANSPVQDNVMVVGVGFHVEGHVSGQGALLIKGSVQGDVTADTVKLSEGAKVMGHVQCRQLDVAGLLEGGFSADDVVVRAPGSVHATTESVSRRTVLLAGEISGLMRLQQLKVETTGRLSGQLRVAQMDVDGHVQGHIEADDVVVRGGGTVDGQLIYGNLAMERGSDVSGQIQRKERRTPSVQTPAPETVQLHLPVNILQQLRKNPNDLVVSLADGDALPAWIQVDLKLASLVLGKAQLKELTDAGQSLSIRVQAGSENQTFKIPPDAS